MFLKPNPLCINGHQAARLCTDDECRNPSIFCSNDGCDSYKKHTRCFNNVDSFNLIQGLMKKGTSLIDEADLIVDFYLATIKLITIELEQYKSTKAATQFNLDENQRKLFKLLEEGPSQNITPQLVLSVTKSLRRQPVANIQNYSNNEKYESLKKNIQQILLDVKRMWDPLSKKNIQKIEKTDKATSPKIQTYLLQNWKFIRTPISLNQLFYYENDKVIKVNKKSNLQHLSVTPSMKIGDSNRKIQFKINKMQRWVQFGAGFMNLQNNKGRVFVQYNGYSFNDYLENQNGKTSDLKFGQGSIVVLEVDLNLCTLKAFNKGENISVVLNFEKKLKEQLFFFALLGDVDDVIRILQ